jgi:CHAT domain-containing protein
VQLWDATTDRKPRIIWCPTGPLISLPLHAAGIYAGAHTIRASDFIVSSYTPSLSALLSASSRARTTQAIPRILCVSQTYSPVRPDLPPLHGVTEEVSVLARRFSGSATRLEDDQATIAQVLRAVPDHDFIHFACHGIQDTRRPVESAFLLHDGPLTLSALLGARAARTELAFLSACETAAGDARLPDEAVHLAAGVLAVGCRGVVGTLWAIGDADAPCVADAFYVSLLDARRCGHVKGGQTGAAHALDDAVASLREVAGEDAFARWVPFVHFGL